MVCDALDMYRPNEHRADQHRSFTWCGDAEMLDNELFSEGVALIGSVSDEFMSTLDDVVQSQTFECPSQLGAARREDVLNEAAGQSICSPWSDWMRSKGLVYRYASVLTAFPTHEDNQYWHRDTLDDSQSTTSRQVIIMVYMTPVTCNNGATQFRRMSACDEVIFEGTRGTVVAYVSSAILHRGLANRENDPRVLLFIVFDDDS